MGLIRELVGNAVSGLSTDLLIQNSHFNNIPVSTKSVDAVFIC